MTGDAFVERTLSAARSSADPLVADLLRVAEERGRVNVGYLAENAALRAKAGQTQPTDLADVTADALLAELRRRLP